MQTRSHKTPLFAAALLALGGAARADLKVVQTTRIDSPQLKAYMDTMTPQQRAQMARSENPLLHAGPQQTTVYVQGSRTRADIGTMTYLVNGVTHQTIILNRRNHTYATRPYRAPANPAGQTTATVKDTGQTRVIAGHPARRYTMTASLAAQPGTVLQGEVWAAQDIPAPSLLNTGGGPLAALQSQFKKIKGYPLRTNLAITGSPLGNTTVSSSVVSVSKAPLPASLFAVPAGYTKSNMGE